MLKALNNQGYYDVAVWFDRDIVHVLSAVVCDNG